MPLGFHKNNAFSQVHIYPTSLELDSTADYAHQPIEELKDEEILGLHHVVCLGCG